MSNTLTATELRHRGMTAVEEVLQRGSVPIVKRNRPAGVVLSEAEYLRLAGGKVPAVQGQTALQWLLAQPAAGARDRQEIDACFAAGRNW